MRVVKKAIIYFFPKLKVRTINTFLQLKLSNPNFHFPTGVENWKICQNGGGEIKTETSSNFDPSGNHKISIKGIVILPGKSVKSQED